MNKPEITKGNWKWGMTGKTKDGFVCALNSDYTIFDTVSPNPIREPDKKAISAVPELIDALIETDKDLCVLETTMRQIEKSDSRAEGMVELVIEWRKRNKQALLKAGCYE
jgi:hypothetical protein